MFKYQHLDPPLVLALPESLSFMCGPNFVFKNDEVTADGLIHYNLRGVRVVCLAQSHQAKVMNGDKESEHRQPSICA